MHLLWKTLASLGKTLWRAVSSQSCIKAPVSVQFIGLFLARIAKQFGLNAICSKNMESQQTDRPSSPPGETTSLQ